MEKEKETTMVEVENKGMDRQDSNQEILKLSLKKYQKT